jgi:hypothetical protein
MVLAVAHLHRAKEMPEAMATEIIHTLVVAEAVPAELD